MRSWKRVTLTTLGVLLVVVLATDALGLLFNDFMVDLWWFQNLGYGDYFWSRLLYRYGVFLAAVVFFFLLFFVNFWFGAKYLGSRRPADESVHAAGRHPPRSIYERFQRRSLAVYLPLTLILAIIVALPLFFYWERALMFLFAPDVGIGDPVFGHDISFYMFSMPIYVLLYAEVTVALAIVLLGLILLYWFEHRAMPRAYGHVRRGARVHLSLITFLLFFMGALYFVGDAYTLLYTDRHLPLFYGPGYEEMTVTLPLLGAAIILLLIVGGLFLYFLNMRRGTVALAVFTVLFVAVLGLRYTPAITGAVHKYIVLPNEMTRQAPYIANNIEATLAGYRLQDVEMRDYPIREAAWEEITPDVELSLQNIPVWDEDGLLQVYRELQEIRLYYNFFNVDVGRYDIEDVYQQVFLSAREIDIDKLGPSLNTWVNRWLKYTHGYGVVMTPASQVAAEPTNWFAKGIPPETVQGLSIDEPAIYYGAGHYSPVIAPNASRELDYASQDDVYLTDYKGDGGIAVDSLYRKGMLALYFGEESILYTTQTTDDSRLLFRRNVAERIRHLTPYLTLDPKPYVVVADGRIYWIQDAMTQTDWYPYATPYEGEIQHFDERFNYIRNSVKIVVDAYHGSVDYYITDPDDPIAAAYARIYPSLFKPYADMPKALKSHVRYPKAIFDVQMDVYARYHQTDPQTFYNQEDVWDFPTVPWRDDMQRITSYYLTLNLINPKRFEYSLFVPMTPLGQRNMRVLAVVGSDGDDYGDIVIYNFPKGTLVYGPAQVDAFVKQDPHITQELTLWNQEGSQADRGRMVVVPVDGVVTYIQGIFLQATAESRMPQLARVVVSQGRLVVMASSLTEGLRKLNELIREKHKDEARQKLPSPRQPPQVTPDTRTESG